MPDRHEGRPVAGYRAQSSEAVDLVNRSKVLEERVLSFLDELAASGSIDGRWYSIGRTHIEQGFMAVNRSLFQPARVDLPDEAAPREVFLSGYAAGMDHDRDGSFVAHANAAWLEHAEGGRGR